MVLLVTLSDVTDIIARVNENTRKFHYLTADNIKLCIVWYVSLAFAARFFCIILNFGQIYVVNVKGINFYF